MSVYLLEQYGDFPASSTNPVILPPTAETSLITKNKATSAGTTSGANIVGGPAYYATQGGNTALIPQTGVGIKTTNYYGGPLRFPCINLGSAALTGYETNGTVSVAGTLYLTEIYVPFAQTWTGAGFLNGTTVGTDKAIVALYGTDGTLLANSAVAGTTTAGASVFQNLAFTAPITLLPGRYFIGVQLNGTTDTLRHLLAANGSDKCTASSTGTFGTIPATVTAPTTFTTAVGVITQLYV